VGSEGTLGIITEATLKLLPLPTAKQTMLAAFLDIDNAAKTVEVIIQSKIIPATLEFLDQKTIQEIENFVNIGLPTQSEAILIIEQDGPMNVVQKDIEIIKEICHQKGAFLVSVATTKEEAEALLSARRVALSALARRSPTTILEDATVPRSQVANMVRAIQEIALKYDVEICTFGHAGDGNLHPTCCTDERNVDEMKRVESAFEEIFAKAIDLGGTITGEHGVGLMKAPYLEWKIGITGMNTMKAIKNALDPNRILNPGKLFAKTARKRVVVRSE
jgi:glycolate oxidase